MPIAGYLKSDAYSIDKLEPGTMADTGKPKFHNDAGVDRISIGARQFQCIGAAPPHDHPHVYLDMGDDGEIVCPYCSTLYVHDEALPVGASDPAEAVFSD